ncbi:MAG: NUMOD4 domain-containing protein [Cyanobacteria bacterium P01_A01_bin.40]
MNETLETAKEDWSIIPEYSKYQASNLGRIRNAKTLKVLKPYLTNRGYHTVGFWVNNKKKRLLVHRLVAMTFIPNPEELPEVNHLNGCKTDNRVNNLKWSTGSDNVAHAYLIGLRRQKLSTTDKELVLQLQQLGLTHRAIGKKLNVSHSTVGSIARGGYKVSMK